MEARNEDARFQGCAECLVWLPCFVVVQASLPCLAHGLAVVSRYLFLDIFSRCNVSLSLALLAPRCAVYCPFWVCCPQLVVVLLVTFLCCLVQLPRQSLLFVCLSCMHLFDCRRHLTYVFALQILMWPWKLMTQSERILRGWVHSASRVSGLESWYRCAFRLGYTGNFWYAWCNGHPNRFSMWFDTMLSISSINKHAIYSIWLSGN